LGQNIYFLPCQVSVVLQWNDEVSWLKIAGEPSKLFKRPHYIYVNNEYCAVQIMYSGRYEHLSCPHSFCVSSNNFVDVGLVSRNAMSTCGWYQRFGDIYCLHLQPWICRRFSGRVCIHKSTRRYYPENQHVYFYCVKKLKSNKEQPCWKSSTFQLQNNSLANNQKSLNVRIIVMWITIISLIKVILSAYVYSEISTL
jgi:hypothetical protein